MMAMQCRKKPGILGFLNTSIKFLKNRWWNSINRLRVLKIFCGALWIPSFSHDWMADYLDDPGLLDEHAVAALHEDEVAPHALSVLQAAHAGPGVVSYHQLTRHLQGIKLKSWLPFFSYPIQDLFENLDPTYNRRFEFSFPGHFFFHFHIFDSVPMDDTSLFLNKLTSL